MVPTERDYHKDHECQISMLYHFTSEDMSQVKVFVTDRQTKEFNVPRFRKRRTQYNSMAKCLQIILEIAHPGYIRILQPMRVNTRKTFTLPSSPLPTHIIHCHARWSHTFDSYVYKTIELYVSVIYRLYLAKYLVNMYKSNHKQQRIQM